MKAILRWAMAAMLLAGANTVRAGTLYIDFGTRSGSATGLRDGGTAIWNIMRGASDITDYSKFNLVDESGVPTAIDIPSLTGFGSVRGYDWECTSSRYPAYLR